MDLHNITQSNKNKFSPEIEFHKNFLVSHFWKKKKKWENFKLAPLFFVQTVFKFFRGLPRIAYVSSIWSSMGLEFHYNKKFQDF